MFQPGVSEIKNTESAVIVPKINFFKKPKEKPRLQEYLEQSLSAYGLTSNPSVKMQAKEAKTTTA